MKQVILPDDVTQEALLAAINDLNEDDAVHGVLMFRPLPKHLNENEACEALAPEKDVDGITRGSMASIYSGKGAGFAPCTAESCIEILKYNNVEMSGKRAVVIGRSLVIGKPVAMLLMANNATVTVCHSRTKDMPSVVKEADIVIACLGRAEMITADYFTPGQIVLDVGINWSEEKNKLVGDVAFDVVEPIVDAITPVPCGVGSGTTAVTSWRLLNRPANKCLQNKVSNSQYWLYTGRLSSCMIIVQSGGDPVQKYISGLSE